ncbi:hypothetical protein CEUSTIGMA_g5737.t1 [Chlamydomonas eustigma]|uniref:SMODS and SLOG-associating 2TM effector domain-containing protein n=1 Tax=Chlamydomonas eustigma TaxID=1157962 RepID=A0A250X5D8_9CHLO|nr:hypothetical protein CEUSTIGMA_g5737.t1 [Chlamydomonas eustigma]|eukprot:GAX78295.1 hypothetical protein CEUSTIGMA_g5737.t1 [Chlamydomonas eustigma]
MSEISPVNGSSSKSQTNLASRYYTQENPGAVAESSNGNESQQQQPINALGALYALDPSLYQSQPAFSADLALMVRNRLKAAKVGRRKYRRATMDDKLLPEDKAAVNYEGQEDLSSEFGQRFYRHGFRREGEKVQDAIRRWFRYYEKDDSVQKCIAGDQADTLAKSFIKTMNENISRNLYTAFLHDLYAQRLRGYVNMIIIPLIFLNSLSAAVGSLSLLNISPSILLGLSIAATLFNLIAAILVAVQKFFMFEEKAALHEAIKDEYFDVINEENFLVLDLNVDPVSGLVSTALGEELDGKAIKERLKKLSALQRKLEGVPDEPVPEVVANELQPYVSNLQKKDGYVGRGLAGFPSVLGIKSYFLEVPEMTGWFSILRNGKVTYQCGSGCPPINHQVTHEGCEAMCCGKMLWHQGYKTADSKKSKLTAKNLKLKQEMEIQAKKDAMQRERRKNRKTLQLMREAQAQPLLSGRLSDALPPSYFRGGTNANALGQPASQVQYIPPPLAPPQAPLMQRDEGGAAEYLGSAAEAQQVQEPVMMVNSVVGRPVGEGAPEGPAKASLSGASSRPIGEGLERVTDQSGRLAGRRRESWEGYLRDAMGLDEESEDDRSVDTEEAGVDAGEISVDSSEDSTSLDVETPLISPTSRSSPGVTSAGGSHQCHPAGGPVAEGDEEGQGTAELGVVSNQREARKLTTTSMGVAKKHGFETKENEDRGSDFGSEYGEEYYPPGFRLPGEKVYEAVWRWWEACNEDDYDAYNARREIRTMADKGKAFMKTMTEAMSRNLYRALLNDAYAQILKAYSNRIAVPLILMNALNGALSAVTIATLPNDVHLALTLLAVALNVVSAVLVAVQKFYKFAERAAVHEAMKKGYFDAYNSETDLVIDLTIDPGTKTFITTSEEGEVKQLDFNDMQKKLDKLMKIEQRASGLPEEAVPATMARRLQPYIAKMQRDGYEDRMHLFSFPPVLGVQSYFLEVPEMTGCMSIVIDGAIACECGHGCQALEHELTEDGCEVLVCGAPVCVCADRPEFESEASELQALLQRAKENNYTAASNKQKQIKSTAGYESSGHKVAGNKKGASLFTSKGTIGTTGGVGGDVMLVTKQGGGSAVRAPPTIEEGMDREDEDQEHNGAAEPYEAAGGSRSVGEGVEYHHGSYGSRGPAWILGRRAKQATVFPATTGSLSMKKNMV